MFNIYRIILSTLCLSFLFFASINIALADIDDPDIQEALRNIYDESLCTNGSTEDAWDNWEPSWPAFCPPGQIQNIVAPESGCLSNNWDALPTITCDATGITCTDNKITGLVIDIQLGLVSIPNAISELSNLETLEITTLLNMPLPSSLSQLSKLKSISINQLAIPAPVANCFPSGLNGNIPSELGQLANLENLSINGQAISGEIPTEITLLSKLSVLELNNNKLSGLLPTSLWSQSSLVRLHLANNNFIGEIPSTISNLSNLLNNSGINLSGNNLFASEPAYSYVEVTKGIDFFPNFSTDNIKPIANAGDDQVATEGTTVNIDASDSIDDTAISSYAWTQISGPAITISNASNAEASFTAPFLTEDTEIVLQIEVSDEDDASDSDRVSITIRNSDAANLAPNAKAGFNINVNENTVAEIDGSNSTDSDGVIVSYLWERIFGPSITLADSTAAQTSFTAPEVKGNKKLRLRLTVVDNEGAASSDIIDVQIVNNNASPTADAGEDQTLNEGGIIALDASFSSDSDGTIESYHWSQVSGPAITFDDDNSAHSSFASPVIAENQTIILELVVTDNNGDISNNTVTINLLDTDINPLADAGIDQSLSGNFLVQLSAESSTDEDGFISIYAWTQTSGPSIDINDADQAQASFTTPDDLPEQSSIVIALSVTDNDGLSDTDTLEITINPNAEAETETEPETETETETVPSAEAEIAQLKKGMFYYLILLLLPFVYLRRFVNT